MTSKNFITVNGSTIHFAISFAGKKSDKLGNGFEPYQHNVVLIKNMTTKKSTKVDFWGSKLNPNQDSEQGLKNALECITNDISVIDSSRSIYDFCMNTSYTMTEQTEKIYKAAIKEHDKVMNVLENDWSILDNIYTWINY